MRVLEFYTVYPYYFGKV